MRAELNNLYGDKETVLKQYATWREETLGENISVENVQWVYDGDKFELEWLVILGKKL